MKCISSQKQNWLSLFILFLFSFSGMAQSPPSFTQAFTPGTIGPGSTSTLVFTIDNTGAGTIPLPDMNFTSTLPASINLAAVTGATTDCGGPSVTVSTAVAGGNATIAFSGGRLNAGGLCSVSVNVTSGTVGTYTNPAVTLFGINNDPAVSNPADLEVASSLPGFSKSFADASVFLGETTTLTFTIDNSLNANRIGALDFTDILPTGMVIADPSNLAFTCGSALFPNNIVTAEPGSSQIIADFNGSTFGPAGSEALAAGSSCTVSVDVLAAGTGGDGTLENVTQSLQADFNSAGTASANLDVNRGDPLHIQKSFINDPVVPGSTVTLDFTIFNFSRSSTASLVSFTDDLSSMGINTVTFGSLLSNSCGGTVTGSGTSISLSDGFVSPGGSCMVSVSLDVGASTASGAFENTSGAVTGNAGGAVTGNIAKADLFVEFVPSFTKTFQNNPRGPGGTADLIYTITNADPGNDLTDISFTDEFPTIIKTASVVPVDGECGAGSVFTFTPFSDPGGFSNVIPATLSLTGGAIPVGGSCTFSLTLDVPSGTPGGTYTSTSSVLSGTLDGIGIERAPATDDLEVLFTPIIQKSFSADVVIPGGQVDVIFDLSYSDLTAFDATSIAFTDDLNAFLAGTQIASPNNLESNCGGTVTATPGSSSISLTGGSLTPGSSCSITVTLDIDAGAALGTYSNTTNTLTAEVNGQNVSGIEAEDDLLVTNLNFTQEFIGGPALPGDLVTLRFTIENTGSFDATGIQFTNSLSSTLSGLTAEAPLPVLPCGSSGFSASSFITYTGGSVPAGTSCSFDVPVRIPASTAVGFYQNSTSNIVATINGSGIVLPPAVDGFEVVSDLLEISKEFTNDPVAPGATVDLAFTINNLDATQTINNVTFEDDLENILPGLAPSGSLPTDPCGTGSVLNFSDGVLTLSSGTLNPSGSCSFIVTLGVPATSSTGSFINTSGAVSGTASPNGFMATGGFATDVLEVIAISLSKAFSGAVGGTSETVDLTFTLENLSTANAVLSIKFFDDVNAMLTGTNIISLPTDISNCGESASLSESTATTLAFEFGELGPGGSCSFTITLQAPCDEPAGMYSNSTSDVTTNGQFIAPPATAILDYLGFDMDGDGVPSCAGDCDDNDANNFPGNIEICDGQDNDCDGQVDEGFDTDGDGVTLCGGDCNDNDATVFPGAPELCDGIDNDCDGVIPNDETDDDGDGFSECQGDCNDADASIFPGAPELCDGLDNDCDGTIPSDEIDDDGDGLSECEGDCNDADATVFPGAPELCDGLDNDCDGTIPSNEIDGDGDGQSECAGDCNDSDPTVFTGAPEICDGIDNDCDGVIPTDETDDDGDGFSECQGDCNDADASIFPGAPELCDGLDNDCDGTIPSDEIDDDGDGLSECEGDCNDADATVFPGAPELCDGLDNDCDGTIPSNEIDGDGDGQSECAGDCNDSDPTVFTGAPEICDGLDNDCDGTIPSNEIDGDGDGFSECQGDCDDSDVAVFPGATELCDGLDNNCDGQVDEGLTFDLDGDGFTSIGSCEGTANDCDDNDPTVFPGATDICDGIDNDCDGLVDEDTPDLTISESAIPAFCQGLSILTAEISNPIPPLSYNWSGGLSPDQEVTVFANGTYTVTVTNGIGCSATDSIVVDVIVDELLSGYVIVAKTKVETKESTVNGGGIGVTRNDGEAKLDEDSEVFTFVKANEVEVTGGSTAALVIEEKANLTLPPFRNSDNSNNNDIKVEKNETMTLTGSSYGKIEVEENATLIFDNPEIFVKEIKAKEEATVDFLQPCEIMVNGVVELDKKNSFNPSEQAIIVYLKDKLAVEEESDVVGAFYTKKEIEAKGKSNNKRTTMTGLFISLDEVKSDKYTDWNWSPNCYVPPVNGNLGGPANGSTANSSSKLTVNLYPNPAMDRVRIELGTVNDDETTEIEILDQLGRRAWMSNLEKGQQSVELDLTDKRFVNGVYFVNVRFNNQRIVKRLAIVK
ncbi:MAG: MopE-related protein [Bacteroidota bacterium]